MVLAILSLFWGSILGQTLLTAPVVAGWVVGRVRMRVYRLVHFKLYGSECFEDWLQSASAEMEAPAWFLEGRFSRAFCTPFIMNCVRGLRDCVTTWTLLVVPQILWFMAWYTGWHISFNKMYEESTTGISVAFLGVVLFALVMLFLPLAQVRHAFTGDWRTFYALRILLKLSGTIAGRYAVLALLYLGAGLFVAVGKSLPTFFPNFLDFVTEISDEELRTFLRFYYLGYAGIGFLLYLGLRRHAARLYVDGLIRLLREGSISLGELHEREQKALADWLSKQNFPAPNRLRQFVGIPVRIAARLSFQASALIIFAAVAFLVFVGQFAHYYPYTGFLNHPLIQLPCFNYMPWAYSDD
jgi:hypothetical protein